MKIIPLLKCRNMKQAVAFYTGILDFELKYQASSADDWVIDLIKEDSEMQLTMLESDTLFGSVINIYVDDVDALFKKYLERGLDTSRQEESPVHQGPVDQSWGNREFYVTDLDSNTLRFFHPFKMPKAVYLKASPYVDGRLMNLPVANVAAAVSFYTNVMNFQIISVSETPVPTIVLARDDIQMAIAENGGDPTQEGSFFEVDNVENAMKELQLNGLKKETSEIGLEKHGEVTWRIFYLLAPDGLCYCFGEKQL